MLLGLFSPSLVSCLNIEQLDEIVGEDISSRLKREQLMKEIPCFFCWYECDYTERYQLIGWWTYHLISIITNRGLVSPQGPGHTSTSTNLSLWTGRQKCNLSFQISSIIHDPECQHQTGFISFPVSRRNYDGWCGVPAYHLVFAR